MTERQEEQEMIPFEKRLVQVLIRNMMSRYTFDSFLRNTDPEVSAEMYEEWTRIISEELRKKGIVDKVYEPVDVKNMGFWDKVMVRESYYIGDGE